MHIALKTTTSEGDQETGCISLEGMFVFVVLRPANRGCIASEGEEEDQRKSQQGPLSVWDRGRRTCGGLTLRTHQTAESQRDMTEDRKRQRQERRKQQGNRVSLVAYL